MRYRTTKNGYKFDKLIFWGGACIMVVIVLLFLYENGYKNIPYVVCDEEKCLNPLIDQYTKESLIEKYNLDCSEQWCFYEVLPRGEYGKKPLTEEFTITILSITLLGFVLNHVLHNKGKKFDLGLKELNWIKAVEKYDKYNKD